MMDAKINKIYPNCSKYNCLNPKGESMFGVSENKKNGRSIIVNPNSNAEFIVQNDTAMPLRFLAIDACIWTKAKHARCDFAIYNKNEFCFIELKCDTSTKTGLVRRGEDAIKQIVTTIDEFTKDKIDLSTYKKLEAYIVYAKKMMSPNTASNFQVLSRSFRKKTSHLRVKIDLIKGNRKIFKVI